MVPYHKMLGQTFDNFFSCLGHFKMTTYICKENDYLKFLSLRKLFPIISVMIYFYYLIMQMIFQNFFWVKQSMELLSMQYISTEYGVIVNAIFFSPSMAVTSQLKFAS